MQLIDELRLYNVASVMLVIQRRGKRLGNLRTNELPNDCWLTS
jgi:hypothetical protein